MKLFVNNFGLFIEMKRFLFICLVFLIVSGVRADTFTESSFPQKLIFTETPETGHPWHGGLRMHDLLVWDGYWNVNGWLTLDVLTAGVGLAPARSDLVLKDRFSLLTLKTRAYTRDIQGHTYKIAGGYKLYRANFSVTVAGDTMLGSSDGSAILFLTQSCNYRQRHYFNLFTSLSFRRPQGAALSTTCYVVPGYALPLSKHWYAVFEYYMTNTERLPLKILQYAFDPDQLDFYNPDRDLYSFMIWGARYSRKHFYLDLTLANHYTFRSLVIPMVGLGWDF
jgi:hypothetical protein